MSDVNFESSDSPLARRRKKLLDIARTKLQACLQEIHMEEQLDRMDGDEEVGKMTDPILAITMTVLDDKSNPLDVDRAARSISPAEVVKAVMDSFIGGGYGGFTLMNRRKIHGTKLAAILGAMQANIQVDSILQGKNISRQAVPGDEENDFDIAVERSRVQVLLAMRTTIAMLSYLLAASPMIAPGEGRSEECDRAFKLDILSSIRDLCARYVLTRDQKGQAGDQGGQAGLGINFLGGGLGSSPGFSSGTDRDQGDIPDYDKPGPDPFNDDELNLGPETD